MWNRFRYRLAMFFYGRNGMDSLNKILFTFSLLWLILYMITKSVVFDILYLVSVVFFLFRFLSKNLAKRRKENEWVTGLFRLTKVSWQNRKEYVTYRCTCGRIVRIPRHKGKVEARCPGCTKRRIVNTGKKK